MANVNEMLTKRMDDGEVILNPTLVNHGTESIKQDSRFEDTFWYEKEVDDRKDNIGKKFLNIFSGGVVKTEKLSTANEEFWNISSTYRSTKKHMICPRFLETENHREILKIMLNYMRFFPLGNPSNVRITNSATSRESEYIEIGQEYSDTRNLEKFLPEKFAHPEFRGNTGRPKSQKYHRENYDSVRVKGLQIRGYSEYSSFNDREINFYLVKAKLDFKDSNEYRADLGFVNDLYATEEPISSIKKGLNT